MASKFQRMYEDAMKRVEAFERVRDDGASAKITYAALAVINRNNLTAEFVDELSKPKPKEGGAA